jgi:hypothetical protein
LAAVSGQIPSTNGNQLARFCLPGRRISGFSGIWETNGIDDGIPRVLKY